MKKILIQNTKKRKYPIKRFDLPIPLHTDLKIFAATNDLFIHEESRFQRHSEYYRNR